MTRKDFEAIAAAIKDSECRSDNRSAEYAEGVTTQRRVTAIMVAGALEGSNPRFDRARFLKACGVD